MKKKVLSSDVEEIKMDLNDSDGEDVTRACAGRVPPEKRLIPWLRGRSRRPPLSTHRQRTAGADVETQRRAHGKERRAKGPDGRALLWATGTQQRGQRVSCTSSGETNSCSEDHATATGLPKERAPADEAAIPGKCARNSTNPHPEKGKGTNDCGLQLECGRRGAPPDVGGHRGGI